MHQRNRKSIRLIGYPFDKAQGNGLFATPFDFAQGRGWYFVTICTKNRELLLGDVVDGKMILNDWGKIADIEWQQTEELRKNIKINQYIIMPNHRHGIIAILDNPNPELRAYCNTPQRTEPQPDPTKPPNLQSPSNTFGVIIRGFKSTTTKQINQICNTPGISVWQRNYYERIIRDEPELNRIRKYIIAA